MEQAATVINDNVDYLITISKYAGAAFVMGIGTLGVAKAQGNIGATACESLSKTVDTNTQSAIRNAFFLAMIFVEASAIYCFILALILIYGK